MLKLAPNEQIRQKPVIQMVPLVDILFFTLIFFMCVSIYAQMEAELTITVPKAKYSKEDLRNPGEIIINVNKDGRVVVNQKSLAENELGGMLKKVSALFPNQAVIIRADERTMHKYVVNVLDACASANIWNISFATIKENLKK
ncbi:MAG: biopolymer transporter ExbD [Candidatus Omnitrophica bacterium]|nr:biopolymer transporter ExbD [Candidatus Omnitrophota bacterium]